MRSDRTTFPYRVPNWPYLAGLVEILLLTSIYTTLGLDPVLRYAGCVYRQVILILHCIMSTCWRTFMLRSSPYRYTHGVTQSTAAYISAEVRSRKILSLGATWAGRPEVII